MQQSRTKNTLVNTAFATISRITSMVMGFVLKTIFIRTLGKSYTGVSGLFTDLLTVLSLTELGLSSAIAYSLYKPLAQDDHKKTAQLMNFFRTAYRIVAAVVLVLGICMIPLLKFIVTDVPDIREDIKFIFILYVIQSAVSYLLVYKYTLLTAGQNQHIISKVQTVYSVVGTVSECIILLVFRNFVGYLISIIIIQILQNITINYIATKKYPQLKQYSKERLPKQEKKKVFDDVKALMMYKISNVVDSGVDSTIISTSQGTGQVGVLGSYRTIRGYITSFIAQFFNAVNPSLGNLAATSDAGEQYNIFKKLNFGTFWLSCFCAVCFYNLFNPFILIWLGSEEWLLSKAFVFIYVLEFFFSEMNGPVGAFRIANGLFRQTKYLPLVKACINLCISLILVNFFGITGIILGTFLALLLTSSWYEPVILFKNVFKNKVSRYFLRLSEYLIITVLSMLTVDVFVSAVFNVPLLVEFIIRFILSIIVPNIIIILFFRKREEYKEFMAFVKNIFGKFLEKFGMKFRIKDAVGKK